MRSLFAGISIFCLSAACLLAQSDNAQLSGFVRDSSQAVVAGANVTVRNEGTGVERQLVTNETGYFVASSLPPGFYTVSVESTGFKKYVSTQNKLDSSIAKTVNVTLEVGAVAETVEVVASVASVQSETAMVGKLIEETQIKNMSLNGRNPLFLALLKPGVRGGALNGFSFGLTSGGFSVNGSRSQDNLITMDGAVAVRTRSNGTSIGVADLETVQEIQVLTANFAAEYGRSGGGQIRIVTKSGSRDFHGSFYEYFRNNALDANSWSRNRAGLDKQAERFNQFGYVLSGPVYLPGKWNTDRSKLFWLWSQEWVRRRRESTSIQTVPSAAMRTGDFSELLSPNSFFRTTRVVNDPETGQPFPNNIIPASRLSSNGLGFLKAFPEPVAGFLQGTANFIQTRPQPANQRKDTLSFDILPTLNHTVRLRYQKYGFFEAEAFRGGTDRARRTIDRPNDTASLNHVWTISPTMINEFMVTASVDRVRLVVPNEEGLANRSRYGIDYPYLFPERKEIQDKIPTIAIANFVTVDGGPYPASSSGPIWVFSNNLTKIAGNHSWKFGFLFERMGQNDFDQINVSGVPGGTNNQNGRFVFSDRRTGAPTSGIAIANAAMGLFDTYAEIGPRSYTPYRGHMFEWFIQDSWKATQNLRVEAGLRHTLVTPYFYSLWNNMAVFDPARYNPNNAVVQDPRTGFILSGDRFNGVVIPGKEFPAAARGRVPAADSGEYDRLLSGGSRYWGQYQYKNFQPRVGLAYSINPKSVVRAGIGRFMTRHGVADNIFLGGNPPFQPMVSIANGNADSPAGGRPSAFPQFFMTSDPVFKIPGAWNWNLTFEREVGMATTVSVAYVGRVGEHLERERNLNALAPGTLQRPENRGVNVNVLRPFKGFAAIPMGETAARSEYNGIQIEATRRFSKGLSYGVAYTYSKSMDNASGRRDRMYNSLDDRNYWGPSSFDTRHVAVINFIYELPFLRDRNDLAGTLLGGWQVTGVTQFQTGTPITIRDRGRLRRDRCEAICSRGITPGDPKLARGERAFSAGAADSNFYFRTRNSDGSAIFSTPAAGTFGNQTRNQLLHNVGFQNWNIAVFKDFRFAERHAVQFRTEFFNFPNHPNWSGANTNPRSSTFGKVTGKGSERNVQLSLRYSF
ncbi:MAG: carboxypeptidase regulatory-like domain-containing protein [Bryobacteraceae bacterium]